MKNQKLRRDSTTKSLNQNKMGLIKDKANSLKKDPWYKKLRRWVKFKLWLWKNGIR